MLNFIKGGLRSFVVFLKSESKAKYEYGLLFGTILTFLSILISHFLNINLFIFWSLAIFGKIFVVFSIMGYLKYRKLSEGVVDDPLYGDLKKVMKKTVKKTYPVVKKGAGVFRN